MRATRLIAAPACLLAMLGATACGSSTPDEGSTPDRPVLGQQGTQPRAAERLGFPTFATKNTTRVGGGDAVADAAAVAQAVFPGANPETRPPAVAVVDKDDWRAGVLASVLMAAPLRAPTLLTDGSAVPGATKSTIDALDPRGTAVVAKGAQI